MQVRKTGVLSGDMMYGDYRQCIILSSVIILVSRDLGYRIINKIIHCIVISLRLKIRFLSLQDWECKGEVTCCWICGYVSLWAED